MSEALANALRTLDQREGVSEGEAIFVALVQDLARRGVLSIAVGDYAPAAASANPAGSQITWADEVDA